MADKVEKITGLDVHFHPDKGLHCPDITHADKPGALTKLTEARGKFNEAAGKHDKFKEAVDKLRGEDAFKKLTQDDFERATEAALGHPESLAHKDLNKDLMGKIEKLHTEHLSNEASALKTAHTELDTLRKEVRSKELETIAGIPSADLATKVKNHTKETEDAIKKAHEVVTRDFKRTKGFGYLRADGIKEALSQNLGGKGWDKSKAKVVFKYGITAAGVGAMIDAAARSEKTGPDGQPEHRGALGRWTEFVIGGAAAATAALGGRARL